MQMLGVEQWHERLVFGLNKDLSTQDVFLEFLTSLDSGKGFLST